MAIRVCAFLPPVVLLLFCLSAVGGEQLRNAAAIAIEGAAAEQGDENALASLRLRATGGDALAQTQLGSLYDSGAGVKKQDYYSGVKWYLQAAKQGFAPAQSNLANHFEQGHGVNKDHAEAIQWMRKAAEQGFSLAQWNLSSYYRLGIGANINYEEAYFWASLAALTNSSYITGRDELSAYLTREKQLSAKKRVEMWKAQPTPVTASGQALETEMAEIIGHDPALLQDSDISKIIANLKSNAEQGDPYAQDILGDIYYRGELGVEQNHNEAVKWWTKATNNGNITARSSLGNVVDIPERTGQHTGTQQ